MFIVLVPFFREVIFMQTDKPFKTIDEQIHILTIKRHLSINNVEAAKDILQRYGYYEMMTTRAIKRMHLLSISMTYISLIEI